MAADPGAAPYPGLGKEQFSTGWGSAAALTARPSADLLRGSERILRDGCGDAIRGGQRKAAPGFHRPGVLHSIWRFVRPHNGTPLELYERGVVANGRFYDSAIGLREGLGLSDSDFDGSLGAHPDAKAWYEAWFKGH